MSFVCTESPLAVNQRSVTPWLKAQTSVSIKWTYNPQHPKQTVHDKSSQISAESTKAKKKNRIKKLSLKIDLIL